MGDESTVAKEVPQEEPEIVFSTTEKAERLKITRHGFFVDGRPVPVDDDHDVKVYEAFKSFVDATAPKLDQ